MACTPRSKDANYRDANHRQRHPRTTEIAARETLSTAFSEKNALKALKAPFSNAALRMIGALLHDFDRQNVTLRTATGQVAFRRSPSQSGYKWDNIFVCALRIGERPMGHPALRVIWSRAGDRWCGVFQVVKDAQSRERTERTLLAR
jgi:hypothetical protein